MTSKELAQHFKAKRSRDGHWMTRCPAHEDRAASLSIVRRDRGRTSVKCFAACSTEEIMRAAGLRTCDLFEDTIMSPETKLRLADQATLERLERRHLLALWMVSLAPEEARYWQAAIRGIEEDIRQLRMKLYDWTGESLRYAESARKERSYEAHSLTSESTSGDTGHAGRPGDR